MEELTKKVIVLANQMVLMRHEGKPLKPEILNSLQQSYSRAVEEVGEFSSAQDFPWFAYDILSKTRSVLAELEAMSQ